jgi:hypothetical protein
MLRLDFLNVKMQIDSLLEHGNIIENGNISKNGINTPKVVQI